MKRMKRMIAMALAAALLCGTFSMTAGAMPRDPILIEEYVRSDLKSIENQGYQSPFKDISRNDWYYPYVCVLNYPWSSDGPILRGKTATKFAPGATLSRAEFAVMLHRAALFMLEEKGGSPYEKAKGSDCKYEAVFKDVAKGQWYTDAVMWAYHKGIITGYTAGAKKGSFGLTDNVTREQVATMLLRLTKAYKANPEEWIGSYTQELNQFSDAKQISSFAKNGMLYAIARGMISGKFMKNGDIIAYRLDPQGKATRAEAAKIFYVYLG